MFTALRKTSADLGKKEIADYIAAELAGIWKDNFSTEIAAKIGSGIPLSESEKGQFIYSEAQNIANLREAIGSVLQRVQLLSDDYLETLIGPHAYRTLSKSGNVTKFLVALDSGERFYIDLFFFSPRAETAKHAHNAHCVSYQLLGNLREAVYVARDTSWEIVSYKQKREGESTIVSPHGDEDDTHAIHNDSNQPAATLHIYAQRVLGADGVVKVNRSNHELGPTSVVKYLSGLSGRELAIYHDPTTYRHVHSVQVIGTNHNKKEENMSKEQENAEFLRAALESGATAILPRNRERLLPRPPQELQKKLDTIIAGSFEGFEQRYNSELQFSPDGLVIS